MVWPFDIHVEGALGSKFKYLAPTEDSPEIVHDEEEYDYHYDDALDYECGCGCVRLV